MTRSILRAGDDRIAPLVCVHPIAGRADVYRPLAAALDWRGPILGISAPDPTDAGYRLTDLATRYCDELDLRTPVLLLGWALGGVIAAEMSHAIVERGGEVAFLGILDSRAPQPEMRTRPTDRDTLARAFLFHAAVTRELAPLAPPTSSDASTLLAALRALGAADDIPDEHELEHRLSMFMGLGRALFQHEQRSLPVTLHLFESADAHPAHPKPLTLGWEGLAPRIERHVVAGTHFTLLAASRSRRLAQTVSRCLPR